MSDIFESIKRIQELQKALNPLGPLLKQQSQIGKNLEYLTESAKVTQEIAKFVTLPSEQTMSNVAKTLVVLENSMKGVSFNYSEIVSALDTMARTPELLCFQNNIVSDQLQATIQYITQINTTWNQMKGLTSVFERSIAAQNIAMIKFVPNYNIYQLPYGMKTVLKGLSKRAAKKLTETDRILFDTEERKFYHEEIPENKVTSNEITVIESSVDVFGEIPFSGLIEFESVLADDNTFALQHPVGRKIFEIIQGWSSFIDFDCATYFHARKLTGNPYIEQEMLKAPQNVSAHGRYNAIGKSCYYFANTLEGAANEIRKHSRGCNYKIQIAEIRPIKKIKMLDLSQELTSSNNFIEHLRFSVENDDGKIIKEYLLPNFVASCCKYVGIEGIKYRSGNYFCYVTWKDDYFEFVEHRIIGGEINVL